MITIAGLMAAAAAVLFWPKPKAPPSLFAPSPAEVSPAPRGPTYQEAIANLANVRKRLADTDTLGDAEKKSIDTLTLALVAGSDS